MISIIDLGEDFYLIKFSNAKDVDFVLSRGPWMIFNYYLTVYKWFIDFNLYITNIDFVALWIQVLALLIHYCHRDVL